MVPLPVPDATLTNGNGMNPLQIVWLFPIDPAVGTPCTVTVTDDVAAWHVVPFSVEIRLRL